MTMPTPTPHIAATPADFAKTVLMPGDPLRAKFIAENFLENPRLVNNVRGIQGYTGTYKGVPVSVMASGMGMPSIGIYAYELYNAFGVENIIRVGSAGGMAEQVLPCRILKGQQLDLVSVLQLLGQRYGLLTDLRTDHRTGDQLCLSCRLVYGKRRVQLHFPILNLDFHSCTLLLFSEK